MRFALAATAVVPACAPASIERLEPFRPDGDYVVTDLQLEALPPEYLEQLTYRNPGWIEAVARQPWRKDARGLGLEGEYPPLSYARTRVFGGCVRLFVNGLAWSGYRENFGAMFPLERVLEIQVIPKRETMPDGLRNRLGTAGRAGRGRPPCHGINVVTRD